MSHLNKIKKHLTEYSFDDLVNIINYYLGQTRKMHSTNNNTKGNFENMRSKHNKIKSSIIHKFLEIYLPNKQKNVLDISVGRFGDLHKYIKSGASFVYGIDPDEESIKEAKRRYNSLSSKKKKNMKVNLQVKTISNQLINFKKKFNLVVCNFTIHYFFKNKNSLENVFKNVSNALNDDGYFIGTGIDGKYIINHKLNTDYYKIDKLFPDNLDLKKRPFSNPYIFDLIDRPGTYSFKFLEYLVDKDTFVNTAKKYQLKCIEINSFDIFNVDGKTKNNKNAIDYHLTEHEKYISNMYFVFAFQKINDKK